jgi:hypothetical protein
VKRSISNTDGPSNNTQPDPSLNHGEPSSATGLIPDSAREVGAQPPCVDRESRIEDGTDSSERTVIRGDDPPPPDPFDPARLRLDQDFGNKLGVQKLLTTVPVRKPSKEVFVRTHPDPAYRLTTGVIELKEDREIYLVDPGLWPDLSTEATFTPKLLVTTVSRQGVLSLWPIRLPGPDGKLDDWSRSALDAADAAKDSWVRVQANMSLGAYDIVVARGTTAKPEFPALSMGEILKIAFHDRFITTMDHPVLRKLRGEV